MLTELLEWWKRQITDMIPAAMTDGGRSHNDALIADLPAGPARTIDLRVRRNRVETRLGALDLDDPGSLARLSRGQRLPRTSLLAVHATMLLERDVVLPQAAEADWHRVLRFEIPRLTPFAVDTVFWDGAIRQRDRQRGRITLRLSVVPKAPLAPCLAALEQAGIEPAAIEIAVPGGARIIGIGAVTGATGQGRRLRVLTGVCAGLALIAIALPFAIQSRQRARVDHKIAELRPLVDHAEALRRHILTGSSSVNVLAREREAVGDPLAVLAAVTQALPDNTYITELSLRQRKLDIAGSSAAAAPLLSALSANPSLSDVAFAATVTRDSTNHKDLFSIKATVGADSGATR